MEGKKQRAIVIDDYGKTPYITQEWPVPTLKQGELLVKVQASTINPSDRLFLIGAYFKRPIPALCGLEGTGTVVEAKGENVQSWVGKRVCFVSATGTWCQYAVANPIFVFEIDQDVPTSSACSGIVNPLTVVGFIENYKKNGYKGMIHTAAASSLGKMLVKACIKNNIPLLNIVRREEQAEVLRKLGATDIIVTQGEWEKQLKAVIEKKGFDCVYDALGGGPISETLVSSIGGKGTYYLYGVLEGKPLTISNPTILFSGVKITGFLNSNWWIATSQEQKLKIRNEYSGLLKQELKTDVYKNIEMKDIEQGVKLSVEKSNQGKIMINIA